MAKDRGAGNESGQRRVSRRELIAKGAVAGAGAAMIVGGEGAEAAPAAASAKWDYEVDVVVLGAGPTGLVAALKAHALGASVLIVEQNYDVGGKMLHSSGHISLGGGDAIQQRDIAGTDPQGLGLGPPIIPVHDLEDDPDRLFADVTDWSVVNSAGLPAYRYNDREIHRAWADHTVAVRQFLIDNYVRFARVSGTHDGGGITRARAAYSILKIGPTTDIRLGTVTRADAPPASDQKSSLFSPQSTAGPSATAWGAPGWVTGGFCAARSLEFSAREKGIRFLMHRHMDEIIREHSHSGRVIGVTASYTPRLHPETGQRLDGYWTNGNVDDRRPVVRIRARQAVIVGTGGFMGNTQLRTMQDPRLTDDTVQISQALVGPRNMDGSGVLAGMAIGASLAGMYQNYQHLLASPQIPYNIGTRDRWDALFPGSPVFLFVKARGIPVGNAGFEQLILVNQVGKRFYNETAVEKNRPGSDSIYPPSADGRRDPFTALDWRNSSVEQIRKQYNRGSAIDAALAINEGSTAPDFSAGPIWAIFDAAAAKRAGWPLHYPYIADPPDAYFFKADTLAELARKVMDNPHQKMPLKYLKETVARYNGFADKGQDADFEKPVLHRLDTPPFYAAFVPTAPVDSYGGLRVNGKMQVVDMQGAAIPGLYAGGEVAGGSIQHGIGRASVQGFIAAINAVKEPRV